MHLIVIVAAWLLQSPQQRASLLVDQGIDLSHGGRFQEAAAKFVEALALDPSLTEAHYLLGLVRQQEGRTEPARQSFLAALKLNPGFAPAQARVCELATQEARAKDKAFDQALASCRRAIQLDPKDPEPYFHSGWLQAKLGDYPAAVRLYQTTIRLDPKFPNARFELAMAYVDQRDFDHAIPLLREVVQAEPGNRNAHFQLGSALLKKDQCDAALPHLERAPESQQKHYLLATCYKKLNRPDEAAANLAKVKEQQAGESDRREAKFLAATAHQYAESGQLDAAIAEYRRALQKSNDPSLAIDLAVALLRKGDAQEVIRLLNGRNDTLALYQTALALSQLGRYAQAQALLKRVVAATPEFVEAWYQLGVAAMHLMQSSSAEAAFRKAASLRPDEPAIRLAWAEALEKLGRAAEAREQRELAARIVK